MAVGTKMDQDGGEKDGNTESETQLSVPEDSENVFVLSTPESQKSQAPSSGVREEGEATEEEAKTPSTDGGVAGGSSMTAVAPEGGQHSEEVEEREGRGDDGVEENSGSTESVQSDLGTCTDVASDQEVQAVGGLVISLAVTAASLAVTALGGGRVEQHSGSEVGDQDRDEDEGVRGMELDVSSVVLDHSYCTPEEPDPNLSENEVATTTQTSGDTTSIAAYDANRFKLSSGSTDHTYCSRQDGAAPEQAMEVTSPPTSSSSSASHHQLSKEPQGVESQELFASEPADHAAPNAEDPSSVPDGDEKVAYTVAVNLNDNRLTSSVESPGIVPAQNQDPHCFTEQVIPSTSLLSTDEDHQTLETDKVDASTSDEPIPPFSRILQAAPLTLPNVLDILRQSPLLATTEDFRKTINGFPDPLEALSTGIIGEGRVEELLSLHRELGTHQRALVELRQELDLRERRIAERKDMIMRAVEKAFLPDL